MSQKSHSGNFLKILEVSFYKLPKNIDEKKATGTEKIPPKLAKISAEVLSQPLADAINNDTFKGAFLDNAKLHLFPLLINNSMIKIKFHILDQLVF